MQVSSCYFHGKFDVEVANHLARAIVGAEGVVSGVYLVKVDETSKQDISPQVVWKYRAAWVVDNLHFSHLEIEVAVPLKFECEFQLGVSWCMGGCEVPPCKERSINQALSSARVGLIIDVVVRSL